MTKRGALSQRQLTSPASSSRAVPAAMGRVHPKGVDLVQKLSLGEQWMIYEGEDNVDPRFVVKRHVNPLHSRAQLAWVTPCASGTKSRCAYKIEGSYSLRRPHGERRPMAEIKRKEPAKGECISHGRVLISPPHLRPVVPISLPVLCRLQQKSSFELSRKLAEETNKVRGVTLLFNEPADARKPDIRWRLYVFKAGEMLNVCRSNQKLIL